MDKRSIFFSIFILVVIYDAKTKLFIRSCPRDAATFYTCESRKHYTIRREFISLLFDTFDFDNDGIIEMETLDNIFHILMTPPMRNFINTSTLTIYDRCDTDRDGRLERSEIVNNYCECMENCLWAMWIESLCSLTYVHPIWLANIASFHQCPLHKIQST